MTRYLLRRFALLLLTLLVTSLLVFIIAQVIPGDVCRVILGREAGEAALNNCHIDLGFGAAGPNLDAVCPDIHSQTQLINWPVRR